MNASRLTLFAAIVANVLGWVLPVVYDDRGWRAFRAALSPLWPYEGFRIDPGLLLVLSVASALTNALFVVLALMLVLREGYSRAVLWGAAAATLLNLHWPISMGAERRLLESGYFIWVSSFALLALAAFLAARPARR
ncbi:MAG: hypothetical protein EHM50_05580 [Lysobacterales bacterium]|nr:MAG: hypothetical protein EHM50_05580 [Xanthomonadales bacterium]